MDAVTGLTRLGGVGGTADLLGLCSRRRLRTALAHGTVVRLSRGRYGLATAPVAARAAARLGGVVCHLSAAQHWGWEVAYPPERPDVGIPRDRSLGGPPPEDVVLHWAAYADGEVVHGVTSPVRTVLDCARHLPFPEALAVADSALRHGQVTREELIGAAVALRGPGSAGVRRVVALADGRAANPFESVLRALVTEEGLDVLPQYAVKVCGQLIHPDLADPFRGIVIEADSWSSHAGRHEHDRDCARYNALVISGWVVLRFTWEQVMLSPSYVRWVIRQLLVPEGPPRPEQGSAAPREAA